MASRLLCCLCGRTGFSLSLLSLPLLSALASCPLAYSVGRIEGFSYAVQVAACGASSCYWLSRLFGKDAIVHFLPERVAQLNDITRKHEKHLLNYVLFLRLTPVLPNWFINVASPLLPSLSFATFWWGTFFGT